MLYSILFQHLCWRLSCSYHTWRLPTEKEEGGGGREIDHSHTDKARVIARSWEKCWKSSFPLSKPHFFFAFGSHLIVFTLLLLQLIPFCLLVFSVAILPPCEYWLGHGLLHFLIKKENVAICDRMLFAVTNQRPFVQAALGTHSIHY